MVQLHVRGDGGETAWDGKVDGGQFGVVVGEVRLDADFGLGGGLLIRHENVFEGGGEEVDLASEGVIRESLSGGGTV